jgi:hypothetical protein
VLTGLAQVDACVINPDAVPDTDAGSTDGPEAEAKEWMNPCLGGYGGMNEGDIG